MKKQYKVGDLVRKVSKLSEFQNKTGVVVDTMIAESGFIYRVHWGRGLRFILAGTFTTKTFLG